MLGKEGYGGSCDQVKVVSGEKPRKRHNNDALRSQVERNDMLDSVDGL